MNGLVLERFVKIGLDSTYLIDMYRSHSPDDGHLFSVGMGCSFSGTLAKFSD